MAGFINADGSTLVGGRPDEGPGHALRVDSQGNLLINMAGGNGATRETPMITADQIRTWIANGQGYTVTTGKQTSASAILTGLSLFNPAGSNKTFIVYSARCGAAANAFHQCNIVTTTDPALSSALTPVNSQSGGSASVANVTFANVAVTASGSQTETMQIVGNSVAEFLSNGGIFHLTAGNGLLVLVNTNSNNWFASVKWIEI